MEEKLLKIINHYGVLPQLKYFQSEVFELDEAIIDYQLTKVSVDKLKETHEEKVKHIAEEIADIEVMLLQFKEYYHIDGNEILRIMNEKIDRQLGRIENENNNV